MQVPTQVSQLAREVSLLDLALSQNRECIPGCVGVLLGCAFNHSGILYQLPWDACSDVAY